VIATVLALLAWLLVRTLRPRYADRARLRHCEEHFALVRGADLDRAGWLYGTPRAHDEDDASYRRRIALARARTFAV